MATSQSHYVCQRCGCAVHLWGAKGTWKHAAGRNVKSCGKPAVVMEREAYEKWMHEEAVAAVEAVRRHIGRDVPRETQRGDHERQHPARQPDEGL
jgi:hypothetical protein